MHGSYGKYGGAGGTSQTPYELDSVGSYKKNLIDTTNRPGVLLHKRTNAEAYRRIGRLGVCKGKRTVL